MSVCLCMRHLYVCSFSLFTCHLFIIFLFLFVRLSICILEQLSPRSDFFVFFTKKKGCASTWQYHNRSQMKILIKSDPKHQILLIKTIVVCLKNKNLKRICRFIDKQNYSNLITKASWHSWVHYLIPWLFLRDFTKFDNFCLQLYNWFWKYSCETVATVYTVLQCFVTIVDIINLEQS